MPEGDTVYRAAHQLNEALAGQTLVRSDIRVPRYATVDLTGQMVHEVVSRGKHLLMRVGEVSIHSHLKMEGSWHLYKRGSRWRRPSFQARIVLETDHWQAVGFDLGVLEIITAADEDTVVGHLGPDLLGSDWDEDEAVRRLSADSNRPIGVALLDQRNLAGLGNVYANELCFLRGLSPWRPVGESGDLRATVTLAERLIRANRNRSRRTTTGDTRPGQESYVYGRKGRPCRRCGNIIQCGKLGADEMSERDTYWCPHCQT